jgi:hypothetical protein
MSSERKSITIDSASLIGGGMGGGTSKRRSKRTSGSGERKIRPSSIVQPSTLKKTLLERIKQHQRTRERSRIQDDHESQKGGNDNASDANKEDAVHAISKGDDNFSQSMDFLRKLALKRREQQQHTQKRRHTDNAIGQPEAKTPEAKMLNQVSETLKHGEILTSTGLLGLPVVPMLSTSPNVITASLPQPATQLGSMTMTMPSMSSMHANSASETQPIITDLADMYNNTIAAVDQAPQETTKEASAEPPLHISKNPEDYLPSIFIKEDPPHGCLKNGTKPTFREWATKMLHKPVDTIKNMFGGDSASGSGSEPSLSYDGGSTQTSGGGDGATQSNNGLNGGSSGVDPSQIAGMRVKIRKTKKKRFRIGKHDDVVGVLLKNKQTQRHIQSQHLTLKQKTIGEIRKYLYDHHLLKIGSNAPPDVLRRMYEDAILTGEVKNTNKDVLLHNFMSGGGDE